MKVTYIQHSGFLAELDESVLLFDYYTGPLPRLDRQKKLYIFASHKHPDHFSFAVFDLLRAHGSGHIFLGSDIKLSDSYLLRKGIDPSVKEKITHVGKNKEYFHENLTVKTLRSTDAGVAFIVETEGRRLYHAGDLNWWRWEGESGSFNEDMEKNYKREIDSIAGISFDAAFVPLDPRLGEGYALGMNYFLEKTEPRFVFPMHMWEDYSWISRFKNSEKGRVYRDRIVEIDRPGQEFSLWNTSCL